MKNSNQFNHTIKPISRELIKRELTTDCFLRKTNKAENEVYIVNDQNAPNTLQEIGRLREISFAASGGGTGNPVDLDDYDFGENAYQQLIVWSPEDEEIIGGYRFIDCSKICNLDPIPLSTRHYFEYTPAFIKNYMPKTIELGRSWVQPAYQPSLDNRKGLFSLDNLWDGLGAIIANNPHIDYLFGKITMYMNFNREARDGIMAFMHHYFPDNDNLVFAHNPVPIKHDVSAFLNEIDGLNFREGLRILQQFVKERNESVPPLFNNYMQLSNSLKTFGTALNQDFGDVEETAILLTIADTYPEKRARYVDSYLNQK